MIRRLSCTLCLQSDRPTSYSRRLRRRVCQSCDSPNISPRPLTAADDPWVNSTAGDMPEALR